MDTTCPGNVEDEILKKDIFAQENDILLKFKRQLMSYCMYQLDWKVEPLNRIMDDIENLCLNLPDMADILIKMLGYVKMGYKALEY